MSSENQVIMSILKGEDRDVEEKFLHRLFEEACLTNHVSSDKIALIYRDKGVPKRETKYSELNMNANQLARILLEIIKTSASRANQDDDWIIAVGMKPSDNLVTALLAIWKAGAAYLPIDAGFPENRVELILTEAKPVMVIYDDSYPSKEFFANVKSINFNDLKREAVKMETDNIPDDMMLTKGDASSKAIALYTSGSTGVPKGVRLRHHTFIHRIIWQITAYPYLESEPLCVFKTTLTFIDHVAELWCPLFSGKTVVIVPKEVVKDPEQFVTVLEDYKVQRILGVPTLLRNFLMYLSLAESNKSKAMLSSLKMWIPSGEILTNQLAQEFFEYFQDNRHILVNVYGCTELCCDVCCFELSNKEQVDELERIPVGSPLPNTIIYVLDTDKQVVKEGEIGEIYVAGAFVGDGYIAGRDPGAFMSNSFETNWPFSKMFRTGDFGYMKQGLLYFSGRRDTQIKIRGFRIDISEIEKNINELEYVTKSAVLVYHATQLDQTLVAFVGMKKGVIKKSATIENDLKLSLTRHMIPQVLIVDDFPYLPGGKVDRQELLKMYEETTGQYKEALDLDLTNVPNENHEMAKQVFEVIGTTLGTELRSKLSADMNFFDLGGNSLNSIRTVKQLQLKGFNIGISDFLTAKDLGEILDKTTFGTIGKPANNMKFTVDTRLVREPLEELEKEQCIKLLATSFLRKADLDKYLSNLNIQHYYQLLEGLWPAAIKNGLSFMVKNEKGELVGVSINFDVLEVPELDLENNPLEITFEFLEAVEKRVLENKFKPLVCDIFHGLMGATAEVLDPLENIGVVAFMETEIIKIATARGFKGIFTTNTNPLTQQFGESVFGYDTIEKVTVNEYIDKRGNRPFGKALESQKVIVMYKSLKQTFSEFGSKESGTPKTQKVTDKAR